LHSGLIPPPKFRAAAQGLMPVAAFFAEFSKIPAPGATVAPERLFRPVRRLRLVTFIKFRGRPIPLTRWGNAL